MAPMNPVLLGSPGMSMLGMGGSMYPALEVVPNLLSFRHQNIVVNPYLGGPFAGNPYLRQGVSLALQATAPTAATLPWGAAPLLAAPYLLPVPLQTTMPSTGPSPWVIRAGVPRW